MESELKLTGIEISVVAKALAPIFGEIVKSAKGSAEKTLTKWSSKGFASRIAKKLSTADKIKTIWSPNKDLSLLSIYYPSKIKYHDRTTHSINSLADLPEENVVIEGIVGHGKSMFLRFLYLQELAGLGSNRLPLFIELRTINEKRDLETHIQEALARFEVANDAVIFDYLAQLGRIVILLDGFDELDDNFVVATISAIENLVEKYDGLRIVITSRPSADI
jgi:predicted NACHT family NTPase